MNNGNHKVNLKDKVVVVTGAASGLGAATARAFVNAGSRVACLDVNDDRLESVCAGLNNGETVSIGLKCDVSDAEAVNEAIAAVVDRFGRVDVLVNCAAIDHTVSVEEMSVEQWDEVIGVNLRGPFLTSKAVLPIMKRQKGGHIINVGSTAAKRAWANASAYHASKWGLTGLTRGLGVEGRADNIRVTAVMPGGMNTGFFDRFEAQGIPMPDEANLQDPANVAEAIVFAATLPPQTVVQEMLVTPVTETSWP